MLFARVPWLLAALTLALLTVPCENPFHPDHQCHLLHLSFRSVARRSCLRIVLPKTFVFASDPPVWTLPSSLSLLAFSLSFSHSSPCTTARPSTTQQHRHYSQHNLDPRIITETQVWALACACRHDCQSTSRHDRICFSSWSRYLMLQQ